MNAFSRTFFLLPLALTCCLQISTPTACCQTVCRLKYIDGLERLHFLAQLHLPSKPTIDAKNIEIVLIKFESGWIYGHSNYRSMVGDNWAKLLDFEQNGAELTKDQASRVKVLKLMGVEKCKDGAWHYDNPTKLYLNVRGINNNDALIQVLENILLDTGNANTSDALLKRLDEVVAGLRAETAKFYVFPAGETIFDFPVKTVDPQFAIPFATVAPVDLKYGAISDSSVIKGLEEQHLRALAAIGKDNTTQMSECKVFVCAADNDRIYIETNFRPQTKNGAPTNFPSKLVTRGERSLFFILQEMCFEHDAPAKSDPAFKDFLMSFKDKMQFYIEERVRVEDVDDAEMKPRVNYLP